jgi:hypothetical protein
MSRMKLAYLLTLASYVRPDMTSGAMYAAVPMFEVLVPFRLSAPDWTGSTVSIVAAEKVWTISDYPLLIRFTHRKTKVRNDRLAVTIWMISNRDHREGTVPY